MIARMGLNHPGEWLRRPLNQMLKLGRLQAHRLQVRFEMAR